MGKKPTYEELLKRVKQLEKNFGLRICQSWRLLASLTGII